MNHYDDPFEEFIAKNLEADWQDAQSKLGLSETKKAAFVMGYRRGAWTAFAMTAKRVAQGKITITKNDPPKP